MNSYPELPDEPEPSTSLNEMELEETQVKWSRLARILSSAEEGDVGAEHLDVGIRSFGGG